MPDLTRAQLIETVTGERDAGFTYDDDLYARVVRAIETTPIADVESCDVDFDDIDETTVEGAALVLLTIDFHYGIGWHLAD